MVQKGVYTEALGVYTISSDQQDDDMTKPAANGKSEAVLNMRPRVGSALARVRAAATLAQISMADVVHNVVEAHEPEIMNQLVQVPTDPAPDVPFD